MRLVQQNQASVHVPRDLLRRIRMVISLDKVFYMTFSKCLDFSLAFDPQLRGAKLKSRHLENVMFRVKIGWVWAPRIRTCMLVPLQLVLKICTCMASAELICKG